MVLTTTESVQKSCHNLACSASRRRIRRQHHVKGLRTQCSRSENELYTREEDGQPSWEAACCWHLETLGCFGDRILSHKRFLSLVLSRTLLFVCFYSVNHDEALDWRQYIRWVDLLTLFAFLFGVSVYAKCVALVSLFFSFYTFHFLRLFRDVNIPGGCNWRFEEKEKKRETSCACALHGRENDFGVNKGC